MINRFQIASFSLCRRPAVALAGLGVWMGAGAFSTAAADNAIVAIAIKVSGLTNEISRHACHDFTITLSNASSQTVTGLNASLLTLTSGSEVSLATSAYPDLPPGGTGTNARPFKLGVASWFACGTPLDLILTVTSTNTFTNALAFQQATPTNCLEGLGSCPSTNSFGGGITISDSRQPGRLIRRAAGNASTCLTPTPCPGIFSEVNPPPQRRYDAYAFLNRSGESTCVTISLTPKCSLGVAPMFSAAYIEQFNPGQLCENYLADLGQSPNLNQTLSYSFTVAAASKFVVTVFEVNPDAGCGSYTLKVVSPVGFVDYQPALRISRLSQAVIVSWPTNAANYTLESTDVVAVNSFSTETNQPILVGESLQITNSSGESSRYYRLRKP